ncbi:hypothetical protein Fcan01_04936 [Folsomia candida]|uniref:Uncharacterized protein n=1 Tax=Folsomia candida TaxID=158441 RepID=A0A226ER26_FOLCA|nr:hypothetical protein Fcan01_04936 [Folsomia candida]
MASDILQVVLNHTTGNITPVNKRKQRDCLIISNSIFQYFPSGSRLDDYFRRIESIVLDFYSWFKDEMEATLNIKNRHIMLLKVISTHLNLSFSSCGSDQDPDDRDERDIDFAISSYKLQKQKLPKAVLIHSREKYKITFASVKSRDFTAIFVTLVRPVATYKSNLVQQLQQPTSTVCASTFKELLEDGRPIVGLGGKRPGEYPNLRQIIRTEAEKLANDKEADKANVLLELLKVYEWSEGRKPDHIVKGKFNMLEDEVMLKVIFAIMKNRYAVHHYQIAKDVIVNNEYWAVKYGPRTRRIVEIIGRLVNGGITDHFRSQQELMEYAASQNVLKVYFAQFYADADGDPENDYQDEDIHTDSLKEKMSWFQRMKSNLGKFQADLSAVPISLSIRHFQIIWILLATGTFVSLASFAYESLHKKTSKKWYIF